MAKNREIVIVGLGETAALAHEYFMHDSDYRVVAFAADEDFIDKEEFRGLPIIGLSKITNIFPCDKFNLFIAISSGKLNRNRTKLYNRLKNIGYDFVSYVSSKAFVWHNSIIGENCFILENNTVQPFVEIGNNVILWSGNHIGHQTVIGDNCFISSHCVISGFCKIGENSFIGVNCTIEDNVTIAADNFIGAGAIIQKNTEPKSLYQMKQTELSKVNTHRLFRITENAMD